MPESKKKFGLGKKKKKNSDLPKEKKKVGRVLARKKSSRIGLGVFAVTLFFRDEIGHESAGLARQSPREQRWVLALGAQMEAMLARRWDKESAGLARQSPREQPRVLALVAQSEAMLDAR